PRQSDPKPIVMHALDAPQRRSVWISGGESSAFSLFSSQALCWKLAARFGFACRNRISSRGKARARLRFTRASELHREALRRTALLWPSGFLSAGRARSLRARRPPYSSARRRRTKSRAGAPAATLAAAHR